MKLIWRTAIVIVAATAALRAQSATDMNKASKRDKMSTTYTGCVEDVNHGASFLLTHVAADHEKAMKDDMMKGDTMKKDMEMKTDAAGASNGMNGDHMMASSLALTGSSDFKKYVGQKVTVSGSLAKESKDSMRHRLGTLTVRSLSVVGKSCS
jgi:hypothetical protein